MKHFLTLTNDNRYEIHSEKELKRIEKTDLKFDGFSSLSVIRELDPQKLAVNRWTTVKSDLVQDIFDYLHNLTGSTVLSDEINGLISIFEKHRWDKRGWQKEKPDFPCLFVARWKKINKVKLLTLDVEGDIFFQGTYSKVNEGNLQADEYFIIERY